MARTRSEARRQLAVLNAEGSNVDATPIPPGLIREERTLTVSWEDQGDSSAIGYEVLATPDGRARGLGGGRVVVEQQRLACVHVIGQCTGTRARGPGRGSVEHGPHLQIHGFQASEGAPGATSCVLANLVRGTVYQIAVYRMTSGGLEQEIDNFGVSQGVATEPEETLRTFWRGWRLFLLGKDAE